MAFSSRTIPHLLEPYLFRTEPADDNNSHDADSSSISEPELVIATSVLGASTNWLILRYLCSFLKQTSQPKRPRIHDQDEQLERRIPAAAATSVVLVSFLRDFTFWKENAGRIGLDLDALTRRGRFGYVDGLGVDLFHSREEKGASADNLRGLSSSSAAGIGRLPAARPNPITLGREPPGVGAIPPREGPTLPQGPAPVPGAGGVGAGASSLTSPRISDLRSVIYSTIEKVRSGAANSSEREPKNKVILIIDQLDFLLAASSGGSVSTSDDDKVSLQALRDLLLDLRETTSTTILTLSADQPLIEPQSTTLEKDHANFVLSLLHEANLVLSLRLLDTGVAKDVSGVIRITAGGARTVLEENEYLYHVRGDGSVRVFERGQ